MAATVVPAPPIGAPPRKRSTRRFAFQFPEPTRYEDKEGRPGSIWSIPSILISFSVHVVLIVLIAATYLRGGGGSPFGRGGNGDFGSLGDGGGIDATFDVGAPAGGEGGIATAPEGAAEGDPNALDGPAPRANRFRPKGQGLSEVPPEVDAPPIELPTAESVARAPGMGRGSGLPFGERDATPGAIRQRRAGEGTGTGEGTGGGLGGPGANGAGGTGTGKGGGRGNGFGDGTAGFFGIRDKTTRVVYVVDRSSSMGNHNALNVAKAQLTKSLEELDSSQQFQILFFHEAISELKLDREKKSNLYPATENNRTLAGKFIYSVHADMGTKRFPALQRALELNPEIVFFLSDVDDAMSAREMNEIRKIARRQNTRIHVIEFGMGADLTKDENFLKRLARDNGGSYRYLDVLQFSAP